MNGNDILLDTNTVLYLLNGDKTLAQFLQSKRLYLSFISEIELFSFREISKKDLTIINTFIKEVTIVNITEEIKKETIQLRNTSYLKIPD